MYEPGEASTARLLQASQIERCLKEDFGGVYYGKQQSSAPGIKPPYGPIIRTDGKKEPYHHVYMQYGELCVKPFGDIKEVAGYTGFTDDGVRRHVKDARGNRVPVLQEGTKDHPPRLKMTRGHILGCTDDLEHALVIEIQPRTDLDASGGDNIVSFIPAGTLVPIAAVAQVVDRRKSPPRMSRVVSEVNPKDSVHFPGYGTATIEPPPQRNGEEFAAATLVSESGGTPMTIQVSLSLFMQELSYQ